MFIRLLLVILSTFLLTACPKPIVVVGAVKAPDLCETCLVSSRDNPQIQPGASLDTSKGPGGEDLAEFAERNSLGVGYNNAKFDLFVKGDEKKGAPSMDELKPLPLGLGSWQAVPGQSPLALPLEIRGIELGYSNSEARLVHADGVGKTTQVLSQPIMVQLQPNVMLVPIQVVRVLPPDLSSPLGQSVTRYTQEAHKAYWDDRTDLDTFHGSHPGIPNARLQHAFNSPKIGWRSSDEIWAQCNIQFRMIDCPGSKLGCPDLRATEDRQVAGQTCVSGFNADASANWTAAEQLPGVDRDLPIVVFMQRVTDSTCQIMDVAKSGRAAMGYKTISSEFVLAHEIGHVLGLNDDSRCDNLDKGHLMCENEGWQTEKIRPADCAKARQNAAIYVKRKWGQVVAP